MNSIFQCVAFFNLSVMRLDKILIFSFLMVSSIAFSQEKGKSNLDSIFLKFDQERYHILKREILKIDTEQSPIKVEKFYPFLDSNNEDLRLKAILIVMELKNRKIAYDRIIRSASTFINKKEMAGIVNSFSRARDLWFAPFVGIQLRNHPDEETRYQSVEYFNFNPDSSNVKFLIPGVRDTSTRVSSRAAWILGTTGHKSALPTLFELVVDTSFHDRVNAMGAITNIKSSETCEYLEKAWLMPEFFEFKSKILSATGKRKCTNFEDTLFYYLGKPEHEFQEVAENALLRMESMRFFDKMIDQLAVDSLFDKSLENVTNLYSALQGKKFIPFENKIDFFEEKEKSKITEAVKNYFLREKLREEVSQKNIWHIAKRKDCLFIVVSYEMHGYMFLIYPPKNYFIYSLGSYVI